MGAKGWLHRDVKPSNFMCGVGEATAEIAIIDFGLAKRYIKADGHIPFVSGRPLVGTPRFFSAYVHHGFEPSRRDDLISLAYVLAAFNLGGKLPWANCKGATRAERHQEMAQIKTRTTAKELMAGLPEEFEAFLDYVTRLRFADAPDYSVWRAKFQSRLKAEGYEDDGKFDWAGTDAALRFASEHSGFSSSMLAPLSANTTMDSTNTWANGSIDQACHDENCRQDSKSLVGAWESDINTYDVKRFKPGLFPMPPALLMRQFSRGRYYLSLDASYKKALIKVHPAFPTQEIQLNGETGHFLDAMCTRSRYRATMVSASRMEYEREFWNGTVAKGSFELMDDGERAKVELSFGSTVCSHYMKRIDCFPGDEAQRKRQAGFSAFPRFTDNTKASMHTIAETSAAERTAAKCARSSRETKRPFSNERRTALMSCVRCT